MSTLSQLEEQASRLEQDMEEAAQKALDSLSRYKFMMFGYWAGVWVHLNRIQGLRKPSPFKFLVEAAREEVRK